MDSGGDQPKWSLSSRIASLLKKDTMSDVNFIVGDPPQTFPCHKLILGASSEVFQAMFYGNMPEKKTVVVPDVTCKAFSIILEYFYTDRITIKEIAEAFDVTYAAKKYLLQHLYKKCEDYIMSNIRLTDQNVCWAYERADFLDMKKLRDKCLCYISKNFLKIFQPKSFPCVSKATINAVIQLDTLDVKSEREVLEVLCFWGLKQYQTTIEDKCINLRYLLHDLLKHVRFSLFSVSEFEEMTKKYDILEPSEVVSILLNIGLPKNGCYFKMPLGFSSSTTKRSLSNCNRIEVPTCYRFNHSDNKFTLRKQQRTAVLEMVQGQITIIGAAIVLRAIPEYSKPHRKLDIVMSFRNLATSIESTVSTTLIPKHDNQEEVWDLLLDDFLVNSEGESVELNLTLEGEGVLLPNVSQEQVIKCENKTRVTLTFSCNNNIEEHFPVKEIMYVFS